MHQKIVVSVCIIVAISAFSSALTIFCTSSCKPSGRRCADPWTYQYCKNYTDYAVGTTNPKICKEGTICTDEGNFPCRVGVYTTTTTTTTTTPPPPPTKPPCNQKDKKFPGPTPSQYYICEYIWFQWILSVKDCPTDQIFDAKTTSCVKSLPN